MSATSFRDVVKQGTKYAPEAGRYILYVSLGCPFALRPAITRALKGLEEAIEMCIVDCHYNQDNLIGFTTPDKVPECTPDPIMGARLVKDLYLRACPEYKGIFSVPMLWDRKSGAIVNNESEDIARIFNSGFDELSKNKLDLYPADKAKSIDEWNAKAWSIMSLAREAGEATVQTEYECKANELKDLLLELDSHLGATKYLLGSEVTEADVRMLVSVLRHDIISVLLWRVNHIFVRDLPNTMRWIQDICDRPGMRSVIKPKHLKSLSFSKKALNPNGIVPLGDGFVLP